MYQKRSDAEIVRAQLSVLRHKAFVVESETRRNSHWDEQVWFSTGRCRDVPCSNMHGTSGTILARVVKPL